MVALLNDNVLDVNLEGIKASNATKGHRFLGEREIVHYQRFGEALMDIYDLNESQHVF